MQLNNVRVGIRVLTFNMTLSVRIKFCREPTVPYVAHVYSVPISFSAHSKLRKI
ncbi:hypothetical protein GCM10007105_14870 [Shewanella chilikensis]|nr:hypothetical protein GCM10007105_14870 [Shewanella chilikensis]